MQRESAVQIESVLGNDSNVNTPKIYPKELISKSEQKQPDSLFVPSQFAQTPQGTSSRSSQGSLVGRNRVFVPFLKLPEGGGLEQSEQVRHQKPDDNRFRLLKTKEQATPEVQRNMSQGTEEASAAKQKLGKKGKLLDIGSCTS